jgi:CheY-like chemotaxis protein
MKPLRILVVEDDGIIGFLLGQTLEGMGYEICGIENNEAGAIAAAKRCRPDLMIIDEHLGRGSGLAVIDNVLQDGPMPYVFVSGDTSRIRMMKPLAIVLEKPYFEIDLGQAIWRALARPTTALHLEPPCPVADGAAAACIAGWDSA